MKNKNLGQGVAQWHVSAYHAQGLGSSSTAKKEKEEKKN